MTRSSASGKKTRDLARGIDPSRKIALYVQMANVLRHNIVAGVWPVDFHLPSMDELALQYGVARVTVRQAVTMLAEEGLLESFRGRGTFVREAATRAPGALRDPINNVQSGSGDFDIRILSKKRVKTLPDELTAGVVALDGYVEIRKLHIHAGQPFSVMCVYIAQEYFKRIPAGAEKNKKLMQLLHDHAPGAVDAIYQTMTVEPAGFELSAQLDYAFAAPVAKVVRRIVDRDNRLIYSGIYWYRGDVFIMDMKLPNVWITGNEAALVPTMRMPEGGKRRG